MVIANSGVACQENVQVPRRLLLLFEILPGSEFSREERILIYESLLVMLETNAPEIALFEAPERGNPPDRAEERSKLAAQIGADAWLWVGVEGNRDSLTLRIESYDLLAEQQVIEKTIEKIGLRSLEKRFWDEVIRAVRERYETRPQKIVESEVTETNGEVILTAVPGTEIEGLTDFPLLVQDSGELLVGLDQSATYTLRATKNGYYPLTRTFALTSPQLDLALEQRRASRFAVEFYLNNLTYPGIEASIYIIPNLFFGRIGINTFLVGLPFRNLEEGGRTSFGLSHINFGLGIYLNAPDSLFRFYVAAGAFLRIMHLEERPFWLEPISSVGMFPAVGVEVSTIPTFRFFVEYRPLIYFTGEPELMAASYARSKTEEGAGSTDDVDLSPPFIFPDFGGVIDPTNFNVGLRIQL